MAIKKSNFFFEESIIETIGEVSEETYKPLPNNKDLEYIGKKIPRYDGYVKVSGKAKYTFDLELPNMAYAKTLRSPYPNAVIKSIDISKAIKIKGILEILTFENSEDIIWYGDSSKLFDKHVRYEGDEIACVAAESEAIAEDAIRKINVNYEELHFSVEAKESLEDQELKIHDWGNLHKGKPEEYSRGNVEKGFESSDIIIEDEFSTEVVIHNPTEVHCSVVNWEGKKLKIWDSTQGIFGVKSKVAKVLNIAEEDVQVIKKYMGGGFGGKLETGKYTVMASLLSKKIGRPVRIALDRREMNLAVGNRPDSIQRLRIGVKKDGTISALSHYSFAAVGAYPSGGGCSWPLKTIYKCNNVKTEEYSVFTNTGKARPFRAPGHVQGIFALDSIIDEAAEKIGMDPLEFRIKNYSPKDQVWGIEYSSKLLKEAYIQGADKIGWNNRNKIAGSQSDIIKTGIGMASQIWWGGGGPPAHADLSISKDGKITVYSGTQDLGTGTYTIIAQIVAEILEIQIDSIKVVIGDTDITPYGPSSGGSTTAPSIAPAVRDAAEKMKTKLISTASILLNSKANKLLYKNGLVSDISL